MAVKYLLDTHVWIWMHAASEELSAACVRLFAGLKGRDALLRKYPHVRTFR